MKESKKSKRKNGVRIIALVVVFIILVVCLVYCASQRNGHPSSHTEILNEYATTTTTAATIPTEPDAAIATTTATEPDETQPQVIIPAETNPLANEPTHTHTYSASNTISPTCTTQGYTTFACSCGSSYKDSYTQATGHSWGAWTTTKEATTSAAGEQTRTCAKCSATESQAIAQLPAEIPSEPATCQHSWDVKWYPEQGHYGEYYVMCACGYKCATTEDWIAHTNNYSGEELILQHGSNASGRDYILDSPERYEWICSKCGVISNTQP